MAAPLLVTSMPDRTHGLSPYCVIHPRPDNGGAVLVHALYGSRFEVSADLLAALAALMQGRPLGEVAATLPAEARAAIEHLVAERVLLEREELAQLADPDLFTNRLSPLELAVHRGFNEGGYFPEGIDPAHTPAAQKDVAGLASVPLDDGDDSGAARGLVECLHERRSSRSYAQQPMPRRVLDRVLDLTVRAQALAEVPGLGTVSFRTYPSAGARCPLEVYPVAYGVEGLKPGIYHYHPFRHALALLESEATHRQALMGLVKRNMGQPQSGHGDPAVLLVITAVVGRTVWKYRGMPYQAILQEVGALYQSLHLVAAQLALAACIIGVFPERAMAEILRVDSRDEAQVGLFALGLPDVDAVPIAEVTGVALLERSPFSPDPGRTALRLQFAEGTAEIVEPAALRLARGADGRLICPVLAGRRRAVFAPAAEAALRQALRDEPGVAIP